MNNVMSSQVVRVHVEFYGIARARTGVAESILEVPKSETTLGTLFVCLVDRFPALEECFDGPDLRSGFTANIGGLRFVKSPDEPLQDGDVVLLMSADVGG